MSDRAYDSWMKWISSICICVNLVWYATAINEIAIWLWVFNLFSHGQRKLISQVRIETLIKELAKSGYHYHRGPR